MECEYYSVFNLRCQEQEWKGTVQTWWGRGISKLVCRSGVGQEACHQSPLVPVEAPRFVDYSRSQRFDYPLQSSCYWSAHFGFRVSAILITSKNTCDTFMAWSQYFWTVAWVHSIRLELMITRVKSVISQNTAGLLFPSSTVSTHSDTDALTLRSLADLLPLAQLA